MKLCILVSRMGVRRAWVGMQDHAETHPSLHQSGTWAGAGGDDPLTDVHSHADAGVEACRRLAARFEGVRVQRPDSAPLAVVPDRSVCACEFTVMPNRPVREEFHIREYRVWDEYIEAEFDRTYTSTMAASPQHVVFLTALTHSQKLAYVWIARALGLHYEPGAPEQFKMWWNVACLTMPGLETAESGVVQWMHVETFRQVKPGTYIFRCLTGVGGGVRIAGQTPVYILGAEDAV